MWKLSEKELQIVSQISEISYLIEDLKKQLNEANENKLRVNVNFINKIYLYLKNYNENFFLIFKNHFYFRCKLKEKKFVNND